MAQTVKHLPTTQETRVWYLEELLEKEMATHSSTLAWKIPWTEEPGRLQSTGLQRVGHNWATSMSCSMSVSLVTQPEIKPALSAVRTWNPNHRTTWEFPCLAYFPESFRKSTPVYSYVLYAVLKILNIVTPSWFVNTYLKRQRFFTVGKPTQVFAALQEHTWPLVTGRKHKDQRNKKG